MRVITAYYRKSGRHKWQYLIDRPAGFTDFVISWSKHWLAELDPKYGVTQLGYVVTDEPVRNTNGLKSNAQVTRI